MFTVSSAQPDDMRSSDTSQELIYYFGGVCMDRHQQQLKEDGYCLVKRLFSSREIQIVSERVDSYLNSPRDGVVLESGSTAVRAIHGMHLFDEFFFNLAKNESLIRFAEMFLSDSIYIHQYKINMKHAIEGQCWPWHQDYVYWKEADHIETPRLLTVAIAIDDISMLSGPLCVIPKSHLHGDFKSYDQRTNEGWEGHVSSNLTHKVGKDHLVGLIERYGHEFLTCRAGDVIYFHPQLVHSSSNNLSPNSRRLLLITYNAVSNAPVKVSMRPEFLCASDCTPIKFAVTDPFKD